MHVLFSIAKASVGQYWATEDGTMTLEVSKLVETFMATTGMHISFTHSQRVLAFPTRRHPPAGPARGGRNYS